MGDDLGRHFRMCVEEVVQPVGPGIHQLLEPLARLLVHGLHLDRVDEELHAEVLPELLLPLGFGQTTQGVEEVHLDAVEVVLGLGIHEAEDGVGVRRSADMRDSPVITDDGDVLSPSLPGCNFSIRNLLRCASSDGKKEGEEELLHWWIAFRGESTIRATTVRKLRRGMAGVEAREGGGAGSSFGMELA